MAEVDKTIDIVKPKATKPTKTIPSKNKLNKVIHNCSPSNQICLVLATASMQINNFSFPKFPEFQSNKDLNFRLSEPQTCFADLGTMKLKRKMTTSPHSTFRNNNFAAEGVDWPKSQFQFWGSYDIWDDPLSS